MMAIFYLVCLGAFAQVYFEGLSHKQCVMDSKRYTIRTFRGYKDYEDYGYAVAGAQFMILDIKNDGWCQEYWWCEIIDNHRGVSKIVTLLGARYFSFSRWMHLR